MPRFISVAAKRGSLGNPLLPTARRSASGAAHRSTICAPSTRKTGAELWTGRLPSAGIATPTSYLWHRVANLS